MAAQVLAGDYSNVVEVTPSITNDTRQYSRQYLDSKNPLGLCVPTQVHLDVFECFDLDTKAAFYGQLLSKDEKTIG